MIEKKEDHLNNEISVSGELTTTGLTARAQTRAVAAIDRLLGGVIDIPAAALEAVAGKIRAKSSVSEALIVAEGLAAEKILSSNQDFGSRVAQGFLGDYTRKQLNKEAVAIETIEELKVSKPEDDLENSESLDEDWLNVFDRYAQDASSEKLRKLWGQVLAGEIRSPKSFSLATLRFMSEIDKEVAELFERVVSVRSSEGFILKPKDLSGQIYLDYILLEEAGLLTGVSGFTNIQFHRDGDKPINWTLGDYCLKFIPSTDVNIPVIKITRIGREISRILMPAVDMNFLEGAALLIADQCQSVELYKISQRLENNQILMGLIKKLK